MANPSDDRGLPARATTLRSRSWNATLSAVGTLGEGVSCSVQNAIRLSFELDTDADAQQLATLQALTERYCVVYQTLAVGPELSTALTAGHD